MNTKLQQRIVDALVSAIVNDNLHDTSFRSFKFYLHNTKQYTLKCILLDNKYLYNSIVEKANLICAKNSNNI